MEKVKNSGFIKTKKEPANQEGTSFPQSNWALISEAANRFRLMSSITGVVYSRGSDDEIDLVGQVHNVNSLFTIVMERASDYVLSHFEGYSDDDAEFARGQLIEVTNHIVRSAWKSANGDFDLAKKYCESSVFLIKEIYENASLKVDKQPFVAMTKEIEKYMTRASALVPCIETIIEINAIRNDEIKETIMGGLTTQEMSLNIVNETLKTAQTKVSEIMTEQDETEESLGEQRYSILSKQILGQVKRFFGMVMDKELVAMKESGLYEPIYPKTIEAVKFFMPIVFPNQQEMAEQEEVMEQDEAQYQNNEVVEGTALKQTEGRIHRQEVSTEITIVNLVDDVKKEELNKTLDDKKEALSSEVNLPSYTQDELDAMKSLDRFKILAKIKQGDAVLIGAEPVQAKKEVVEKKPESQPEKSVVKPEEKESSLNTLDNLPIYTQDEIDDMKTIERYKVLAQIKQGKAMLIDQNQGMNR